MLIVQRRRRAGNAEKQSIASEGDVHPKGNPHYNLDPLNGKIIARNIADGLGRNFPQHKAVSLRRILAAYWRSWRKRLQDGKPWQRR